MLMATLTFVANANRVGSPPRKRAKRTRASHKSDGNRRTMKSVGSAAICARSSVARSKTGRGRGPKEPVLRLMTAGSSIIARLALSQSTSVWFCTSVIHRLQFVSRQRHDDEREDHRRGQRQQRMERALRHDL